MADLDSPKLLLGKIISRENPFSSRPAAIKVRLHGIMKIWQTHNPATTSHQDQPLMEPDGIQEPSNCKRSHADFPKNHVSAGEVFRKAFLDHLVDRALAFLSLP